MNIKHIKKKDLEPGRYYMGWCRNTYVAMWDEKKDKVFSEKFVRVRTEDEIIKSEGFESDPSFSEYRFKNIKGIINLHESDPAS